jgi:hypothetical protein
VTHASQDLPGLERSEELRVEGDLLTDVDGTLPTPVLSTQSPLGCLGSRHMSQVIGPS